MPCESFTKQTSLATSSNRGSPSNLGDDGTDDIYAKGSMVIGIMLGLGFMASSAFRSNEPGGHQTYSRIGIEKRNRSMAEEDHALVRQTHSPVSMIERETEEELSCTEQYRV